MMTLIQEVMLLHESCTPRQLR